MQTKNDIVTLCETCVCRLVCDIYCAIGPVGYCRHYHAEDAVEVMHGRWIKAECSEKDGNSNCSNCGQWEWDDCNYCPNCGAKMDLK